MLSKRYESIEADHRTWLSAPSGTLCSASSDTHQGVEIQKETICRYFWTLNFEHYATIMVDLCNSIFVSFSYQSTHSSDEFQGFWNHSIRGVVTRSLISEFRIDAL